MRFSCHPALLFCAALLFFVAGTWSLPLIDRDEPRFAEASREMLDRGDYVVPYLNNAYRFDKPPLSYWGQVTCYRIFGVNDFAARFPSVLAGALTVLVIYGFAKRLYGTDVACMASAIFITCVQASLHAKGAVADMPMVWFFTISTWAAWELLFPESKIEGEGKVPKPRYFWWWAFYGALALGFLAKGPIAWLPLGAVGIFAAIKKPGGVAHRFKFGLGMLLTIALVGAWGIPALIQTKGEFFYVGIGKHVVERSLTTMEGHGSNSWLTTALMLPFYFVTVFFSFFPWSLRLPWLTVRLQNAWRERQLTDPQWFLIIGVLLVFGVFTLVRTKLPHYTLPAFPLLSILLAQALNSVPERRATVPRWAVVSLVVGFAIFLGVFPTLGKYFPGYDLIRKSHAALTPDMEFASYEYQEPSLVWYARGYVHGWYFKVSPKNIAAFMAKPGPRFCVAPRGTLKPEPGWQVFETSGFNIVHWSNQTLELMVKPK